MKAKFILTLLLGAILAAHVAAAEPADDAVALVKSAVEFFKANGKEKACAAISDPKGQFVKGDLYVFVTEYAGPIIAHGGNPQLVGKNLQGLKDADGKNLQDSFIEQAKKGPGWVDYTWSNPTTKKLQSKSSYIVGVPELNIFFACGIYKTK